MQIIILGPPGVGKGTQSILIAQKLGLIHLSTGEILRDAVQKGTTLGKKAKAIMESGTLVSDDIMIGIIKDVLSEERMKLGFILDGFPRTISQAEALDEILQNMDFKDVRVVEISVPKEVLISRMMNRGRKDDTYETVLNRLEVYENQTAPVRNHYNCKGKVLEIHGEGSIEEINKKIVDLLNVAT